MRPVKLGVSEGCILSLKNLQEFQLSVRKGILRNESQTVIYHHSKKRKKHNDGLLFLFIKKDLFDLIGLVLFTEREGTGSNYLGNKANWVMICYLVEKEKCPLEDSYGASFQGRNPSQFRRS